MRIFTSSWFTQLPPEIVRVGISRGVPRGQSGYQRLRELNPSSFTWSQRGDDLAFASSYQRQLDRLDPNAIVAKLDRLGEGRDVCLLCWEAPSDDRWCHRSLVAAWLHDRLGLQVDEIGFEGQPHPKIPPRLLL